MTQQTVIDSTSLSNKEFLELMFALIQKGQKAGSFSLDELFHIHKAYSMLSDTQNQADSTLTAAQAIAWLQKGVDKSQLNGALSIEEGSRGFVLSALIEQRTFDSSLQAETTQSSPSTDTFIEELAQPIPLI